MYVYIDESGCSGFKLNRGSTPYFAVAMVIFADSQAVNEASTAVSEVRRATGHKPEFKFSKCSNSVRDSFFERLCRENFIVRAIVVDKARIYSQHLRGDTSSFYHYFVQMMLRHDNSILRNARIQIDGSGDREFKRELNRYLRQQLGEGRIRSVKMVNSEASDLIQLADMCVGAIHRRFRRQGEDAARWFNQLRPRIGDIWTFPNE